MQCNEVIVCTYVRTHARSSCVSAVAWETCRYLFTVAVNRMQRAEILRSSGALFYREKRPTYDSDLGGVILPMDAVGTLVLSKTVISNCVHTRNKLVPVYTLGIFQTAQVLKLTKRTRANNFTTSSEWRYEFSCCRALFCNKGSEIVPRRLFIT